MLASPRALPPGSRTATASLTSLLAAVLLLPATPATAAPSGPVAATSSAVDPTDRLAVAQAYRDVYLPATAVKAAAPSADAVASCQTETPPELQTATLDAVNFVRALSGVRPVELSAGYSTAAQRTALMMYANNAVSYAPPRSWACYSAAGAEGAANSNLSGAAGGAGVVETYMDEAGGQTSVARRLRLQRPNLTHVGNGTVGSYNALWVGAAQGFPDGPRYTSWPSPGWFPAPMEPNGRWSVSPWNADDDLSQAQVSVTGPDGAPLAVTTRPVTGWRSLVFEVGTLPVPAGDQADLYTVTVTGILSRDEPVGAYSYQVRLFDPTAAAGPLPTSAPAAAGPAFGPTTPPTVTGQPRVGETLTATPPTWSSPGVETTYQWLRAGVEVAGATGPTYTVTAADVGQPVAVLATGTRAGPSPASTTPSSTTSVSVTSVPTAPVADALDAELAVNAGSSAVGELALAVGVRVGDQPASEGTVTVEEAGRALRSGIPVSAGSATFAATGLAPGRHTYTVRYSGTSRIKATSTTVTTTVRAKATPTLAVTGSSSAKGRLAVTVTVRATGAPNPRGTVTIREGSRTLKSGLAVSSSGKASWSASRLRSGKHALTVRYNGTSQVSARSVTKTVSVR